jgi:hypothetical protein
MPKHPKTCNVESCERPVRRAGMCSMHAERFRKHGATDAPAVASFTKMKEPPPCSFEGCERPTYCKSLCSLHYGRLRLHGDPAVTRKRTGPTTCGIDGCGSEHYSKGLCTVHYQRRRRHGDTDFRLRMGPKPGRTRTFVEGTESDVPRRWGYSLMSSGYVIIYPPGRRSLTEHRYVM